MAMHDQVGKQEFVKASLNTLLEHFRSNDDVIKKAVADSLGSQDAVAIESERQRLIEQFVQAKTAADSEQPMEYVHYASRNGLVGLYQSILSKLFTDIPQLQGYGDRNPIWVVTWIEEACYASKAFFGHVYEDVHGRKRPLIASLLEAWKELRFERAPYPEGKPAVITFPDECNVALLADWGGDNPAARRVASVVQRSNPEVVIHLGDIYYGGVKQECEAFVANWPTRRDGDAMRANANFALNGNHEMYSGGESYFGVVLKAFGQQQPFFCLENTNWRLIGLDTAYAEGRLKPSGPGDPLNAQWDWLIDVLKNRPKKATILLTHHQPVSAHRSEFEASAPLRQDVDDLLKQDGIGEHAIFAWFFGHEHRCTIYDDIATPYMARLIGSGCIPHTAQRETTSDPGCTPAKWFNKRETQPGSNSAISMYAELRFQRDNLYVVYTDEDGTAWGSEVWQSDPGRMVATGFVEADGFELK